MTAGGTSPWCRQDYNRTKRADCLGKLPEKRGLRRQQVRGGQGAPLTRLRCPVVPAARKLVFMPPLLLSVFGVLVPFHKRVVSVNFLNTYLPITSPTLKHPNTQHIQTYGYISLKASFPMRWRWKYAVPNLWSSVAKIIPIP